MGTLKKKMLSLTNAVRIFCFLFVMGLLPISNSFSQTLDSTQNVAKQSHSFNILDAHLGWGGQKYFFVGVYALASPILVGGDIGYDFFDNKYITFSLVVGWIPGVTQKTTELSSVFFSFIQTAQRYSSTIFIYTLNIGWTKQQFRSVDYTLSAGAGLKLVSTLNKATLFLGLDLSIGYRFF